MPNLSNLPKRIYLRLLKIENDWRLSRLSRQVARRAKAHSDQKPITFFNASSRLGGMSQNAAFSLLAAWGLQLTGVPVIHFACRAGMSRCVLGTNPDDDMAAPPCDRCVAQSQRLFASAPTHWFTYQSNPDLAAKLNGIGLDELSSFEFDFRSPHRAALKHDQQSAPSAMPLGSIVLPSLRWALRRHHLLDDESTCHLLREYILSAYNLAQEFDAFLAQTNPATVVLFNGLQFPEAAARWVARQHGIPTITHEVSFRPFSTFFTRGDATAFPIDIPADFSLNAEQNARLDAYLSQRFNGEFTMAGIRFWPEMNKLDSDFLRQEKQFEQIVPVFTNVVFDTSQVHANTIFPQMFAWLDLILEIIHAHPETLFVIRAHPDEKRPGTRKQSRESVSDWVAHNEVGQLPNVIFIDSQEYLSSYELIRRAKYVMVYNSSIGLEATLLGIPVLCGGKARYTQYPIVHFPQSQQAYRQKAEELLDAETLNVPESFRRYARRFYYYQLYRVSLPLDDYIQAHPTPGYARLNCFPLQDLFPQNSPTLKAIVDGIVSGKPFLLSETG
ncbi:MAG: hypothetical protein U9Q82_04145 [Chloroflexota bacterium]|nr:hypothetical protein [Chloroflexota bacterium]